MGDGYIDAYDFFPTLPPDLRDAGHRLWDKTSDASWDAAQKVLHVLQDLAKAKGDPAKLHAGGDRLRTQVAGDVSQANDAIQRGFADFRGAWVGRGADAFTNYVPLLTGAITGVQQSAELTGKAVAEFSEALILLWAKIIKTVGETTGKVIAALGAVEKKSDAAGAVLSIIGELIGFAANLTAALLEVVGDRFKAEDTLSGAARPPAGLVHVAGPQGSGKYAREYTGPTGFQLPMPSDLAADAHWSAVDVKGSWQPKEAVALDNNAMMRMVQVFRDNGQFWNRALSDQIDVSLNQLTPDAFSVVGGDFYGKVQNVMSRDYILYIHSGERLHELGDLLSTIGHAYGMVDQDASSVLSDYVTNE